MPHSIVVFLPTFDERMHVAQLLRRMTASVTLCASEGAAIAALAMVPPAEAVVISPRDAAGQLSAPLVRRIHDGFPSVSIVAYGSLSPQFFRDVLEAARCGLHAVALRDHDDLPTLLTELLQATRGAQVAERAMATIDARLSSVTRPVVRYCLEHASIGPHVEQIAGAMGVCRKTIAAWLAAEQLPPASEIVGWGRVLLVARLLEDAGRSVEQIAFALGCESGTALRHLLRRYTGLRAAEVRAQGGLDAVLPLFARALGLRSPRDAVA
jgi:AraC-like DNA-binding protein